MAAEKPPTRAQIDRILATTVAAVLPPRWLSALRSPSGRGRSGAAVLEVVAPDGATAAFTVERMSEATPLDLSRRLLESLASETSPTLVVAPYLSERARALLVERGMSFADATGNLRLVSERPGLFVERQGAAKDPWPDDQPLRALRGRGAGRAVRAVVDFRPPYGVRQLAVRAGVAPATLSRVIDLLAREALVERARRGGVGAVDWAGVIRRWSRDYELRRSNRVTSYLEPRGLSALGDKLDGLRLRYAVTGSLAAQRYAPVAPARMAAVYVDDPVAVAEQLDLRELDAGANVLLLEPFDAVVFDRTALRDGLVTVAPTQLAADLLTGAGREPAEGEALLDWMKTHEDAWRA